MSNSVRPYGLYPQDPLSRGFSRQEYWSGLPCPPPEDLPDQGTEPVSLMSAAMTGQFFTSTTWEALLEPQSTVVNIKQNNKYKSNI